MYVAPFNAAPPSGPREADGGASCCALALAVALALARYLALCLDHVCLRVPVLLATKDMLDYQRQLTKARSRSARVM